jgi:two-component system, NtrC family, response regulator PilR
MRSRILFLSGRQNDSRLLSQMLHGLPLIIESAECLQEARARLSQHEYQSILTEASLADGAWLDVLHMVRSCPHEVQVLVTSPQADAAFWAEALNLGVYDVLAQPFYEPEVRRILTNACEHSRHTERGIARCAAAV